MNEENKKTMYILLLIIIPVVIIIAIVAVYFLVIKDNNEGVANKVAQSQEQERVDNKTGNLLNNNPENAESIKQELGKIQSFGYTDKTYSFSDGLALVQKEESGRNGIYR